MEDFKKLGFTGALLCIIAPGAALADPVITNGSFEDVQISTPFSSNPADIPGWTHTGDVGDALLWRAGPQCCGGTGMAKAGDGNQFVTMGGGFGPFGSSAWSQMIGGLTMGQTYTVSFMMAAEGEVPTQRISVDMTSGSSTAGETFTSPVTGTLFWQNWGPEQYSFVASAKSAVLQFSVTSQQYDVGLDAVSIAAAVPPVPEPESWALLAAGFLGLAFTMKNRRLNNAGFWGLRY